VDPVFFDEVQTGPKTPGKTEGNFFRHPLRERISRKHPPVCLTDLINWERLGASIGEKGSYCANVGRRARRA
jgi:IS5 family transposase